MFLGRYAYAVDAKGRLAIPARFRSALGGEVVLTRGIDPCLSLYPMEAWLPLSERVNALPISDPHARQFRRLVFGEAANLELDSQGRILLPPPLRGYAGIDREAVLVGVHSWIEIWSPERWNAQAEALEEDGSEIAEHLANLI
jgi:MraZ protein